jgi:sialate O-acetylesterase
MIHTSRGTVVLAALFFTGIVALRADVKLPAIFGDHMVLQEGATLPVWGKADPGEQVTVTVGTETGQATAGADGKWSVKLPALAENTAPLTLTVKGKNTLTFSDVLIGDVWLCSGQSNMEFSLKGSSNDATAIPAANDPQMRLFIVQHKTALDPQDDVVGKWELCTPQSAAPFSAVSYFFGHDLRTTLNRPIGLIGSYWGGTPAEAWTSHEALQKDPTLKKYTDSYDKIRADFTQATAEYPAKLAAYKAALAAWQTGDGAAYEKAMNDWKAAVKTAEAAGQKAPLRPVPSTPMPRAPVTPDGGEHASATLYNGMIAPLIPYALKGAIWYQGESNAAEPTLYRSLFPDMIADWRQRWSEGDFPFLFVQLACFKTGAPLNWAYLREAQLDTLAQPNTGMAVAVDIGNPDNIHPADKVDVGHRLALAARHVAYGQTLVYSGPIYQAMKVEGKTVRVSFTQEGGGLIIGQAPWRPSGYPPLPTTSLLGFTITGDKQTWVPANATIDGDSVVVSSPQVPAPVGVRYDWASAPEGNLYNKENLPASPFRTDDVPYDSKVATPATVK